MGKYKVIRIDGKVNFIDAVDVFFENGFTIFVDEDYTVLVALAEVYEVRRVD